MESSIISFIEVRRSIGRLRSNCLTVARIAVIRLPSSPCVLTKKGGLPGKRVSTLLERHTQEPRRLLSHIADSGISGHPDDLRVRIVGAYVNVAPDGVRTFIKKTRECRADNRNIRRLGRVVGIEIPPGHERNPERGEVTRTDGVLTA